MAIRIDFREYPEIPAVGAVASGTVSGRPFGASGQGRTRSSALADLRMWLRFTYTYGQYRAVHPLYRDE